MISEKYIEVSLIGRIAYGLMCVEVYFKNKYPEKKWSLLLKKLWEITDLELWDVWMDEVIEMIPEYLFEFNNYEMSNFEHLSKERYFELVELYKNTNQDVNDLLKMWYELANEYAYSSISGKGIESLEKLEEIISSVINANITLPNDRDIFNHPFSEKNGWGEAFDGTKLSIFL